MTLSLLLPFSDLSDIVVIVKKIENILFILLTITELKVCVVVSLNKIQRQWEVTNTFEKLNCRLPEALGFEQKKDQKQPPEELCKREYF